MSAARTLRRRSLPLGDGRRAKGHMTALGRFRVGLSRRHLNRAGEPSSERALECSPSTRASNGSFCPSRRTRSRRHHGALRRLYVNRSVSARTSGGARRSGVKIVARHGGLRLGRRAALAAKGVIAHNTPVAVRRPGGRWRRSLPFALAGRLIEKDRSRAPAAGTSAPAGWARG